MAGYQPFLISEFKTGLYNYLQPWIRPQDAFEPLVNAYVYRGVLQKRNGSTVFGNQLADTNPVMGIMQYQNESSGGIQLIVATTENAYVYAPGSTTDTGTFSLLTNIGGSNSIFWENAVTGATSALPAVGTISTFWQNLVPSSVTITAYNNGTVASPTIPPSVVGVVSDDGSGGFSGGSGIFSGGSGTIDYVSGAVSFTVTIGSSYNLTLSIQAQTTGAYFSGNISNFFNWTNWQPTSSITALAASNLYMTNNNDPVTIFDGTNLSRPIFYIDSTYDSYIETALDVKTYNNRLLLIRPTIFGESNAANQDIYFSASFNPFNFIGDVAGNGGAVSAATGDQLISADFLRDNLIVSFTNSTWTFQNSGISANPFIFRRINSTKSIKCPYASVSYDERVTNLGSTGFLGCDGVNVQRFDINIIDYYETQISQQYFSQDYGIRYDNLNQTWMFYPSVACKNLPVAGVAPGSDETLVYNFLENTWATYENSFPMTCMGFFNATSGITWADLDVAGVDIWENMDQTWNSYGTQTTSPILLGGDTNGNVYHLDNPMAVRDGESTVADSGVSFPVTITTTRWNPFMQLGQKTQFGYIDIYYSVSSVNPATPIQLTLDFYVSNSDESAATRTLTLDGPANAEFAWKRVYCNLIGEFIQMTIDPSEDAAFKILGFVLWARPAGRLTP
jgi:hypothetical protein